MWTYLFQAYNYLILFPYLLTWIWNDKLRCGFSCLCYLYNKKGVCLRSQLNPPKPLGPSLHFCYCWKALVGKTQCAWQLFHKFWNNWAKMIEFRLILSLKINYSFYFYFFQPINAFSFFNHIDLLVCLFTSQILTWEANDIWVRAWTTKYFS